MTAAPTFPPMSPSASKRNLFVAGEFVAHSGGTLPFKIDCDALTDASIEALATQIVARVPAFGDVYGVPRGGLRLAEALQTHVTVGPVLIVDDVLTTGASMEYARATVGESAIG